MKIPAITTPVSAWSSSTSSTVCGRLLCRRSSVRRPCFVRSGQLPKELSPYRPLLHSPPCVSHLHYKRKIVFADFRQRKKGREEAEEGKEMATDYRINSWRAAQHAAEQESSFQRRDRDRQKKSWYRTRPSEWYSEG